MIPIPFAPTILEHSAALTGHTPSEAARDASIMAEAHIQAFKTYRPAAVTVGIDVYNIEAEALGCHVRFYNDASVPGIVSHPYALESDPGQIRFSADLGRIKQILEAASLVRQQLSPDVRINVGICGPFSVLIELIGYEAAAEAFYDGDERVFPLLNALLEFQKSYCGEITARGLGIIVFESWASPPLISPDIYRAYAAPYELELFTYMKSLGQTARPLVIGGDTRGILDDMLDTGTTLLVSDYNTPLTLYAGKAHKKGITLRANIDPKLILNGDWPLIQARIREIKTIGSLYPGLNIIAGTGVIPYNTPPGHLLRVKKYLMENEQ